MSKNVSVSCLAILAFFLPLTIHSQTSAPSSSCPVTFVSVGRPDFWNRWNISTRVRNTSGKKIVGIVFNAAVADATERWVWIPQGNRIAEFDWNRVLNAGQSKSLSWYLISNFDETLYFNQPYYQEHSSGGSVVLARVLFADGSSWEDPSNREPCMGLWYNPHKKSFVKPIALPPRQ